MPGLQREWVFSTRLELNGQTLIRSLDGIGLDTVLNYAMAANGF